MEIKHLHFTPVNGLSFFYTYFKYTTFACSPKNQFYIWAQHQFKRRLKTHHKHFFSFVPFASPLLALHPSLLELWQHLKLLCIAIPLINPVESILVRKTWKYNFRSIPMSRNPHKSFCLLFSPPLMLPWQLRRYTISALLGIWLHWGVERAHSFFLFSAVIWETISECSVFMAPCPLLLSSHEGMSKAWSPMWPSRVSEARSQIISSFLFTNRLIMRNSLAKNSRVACISLKILAI